MKLLRSHRLEAGLLALIVVVGAALRIDQLGQSIFADEMWTWVGATQPNFGGMLDWVQGDQEITPPLYTSLAWLFAHLGDDLLWIDIPSFLAGLATIGLVFAIARLLFDRRVALIAAGFAALSPSLAYFSVEARAYSLAIALVAATTLTLLLATERRGSRRWWVAYAVLSAAAMYTHYTVAFVLFAQLAWALWFRPGARRPALLANVGAAVLYIPWIPGLLDDFDAPARANHELLAPLTTDTVTSFAGTFAFGNPYASLARPTIGLHEFLGTAAELALFAGLALAAAGTLLAWSRRRGTADTDTEATGETRPTADRVALVIILAVAAPLGAIMVSLVTDDLYLPRNLMTSLPGVLIGCALLIAAAPIALRVVALVLTLGAFATGAVKMLQTQWQRPDVRAAAAVVERGIEPGDGILDAVWFSGQLADDYDPPALPLTLDAELAEGPDPDAAPEPTDAFTEADIIDAAEAAEGHRLWVVGPPELIANVRVILGDLAEDPVIEEGFGGIALIQVVALPIPEPSR